MVVQGAAEAEVVAAVACYCGDDLVEIARLNFAIDCVDAVGCRAPFQLVEVVHVGSSQ